MGLTFLELEVSSVGDPENSKSLELLIDSGAVYSVVAAEILESLGIEPMIEETFRLANGEKIVRKKGGAAFRYKDRVGVADVVFGEPGASILLGALTLEALGLSLDPLKRELRTLPMLLASSGFTRG